MAGPCGQAAHRCGETTASAGWSDVETLILRADRADFGLILPAVIQTAGLLDSRAAGQRGSGAAGQQRTLPLRRRHWPEQDLTSLRLVGPYSVTPPDCRAGSIGSSPRTPVSL